MRSNGATEASLVEELNHNASASGNKALEQRMADFAIWYYKNVHMIPMENLPKRLAFQEKSTWILLELNALMLERLRETAGSRGLFLPSSLHIHA